MKKVLRFTFVLFMLVISFNFVMADLIDPAEIWKPSRPTTPVEEEFVPSPAVIIVVGIVVAVAISALVLLGIRKMKDTDTKIKEEAVKADSQPQMQPVFGAAMPQEEKVEPAEEDKETDSTTEEK